jgi:hypothetical protein
MVVGGMRGGILLLGAEEEGGKGKVSSIGNMIMVGIELEVGIGIDIDELIRLRRNTMMKLKCTVLYICVSVHL